MPNVKERPIHVGLTGGVGSGKSLFARFLGELGAEIIDVDALAREAMEADRSLLKRLQSAFGSDILLADGELNRALLGERAFATPDSTATLNRLAWPVMRRALQWRLSQSQGPLIVADMAVLFESGCQDLFDHVVLVVAPLERRFEWVASSRGWSAAQIRARTAAQWPDEAKSPKANSVVYNDGDVENLRRKALAWRIRFLTNPDAKRLIF